MYSTMYGGFWKEETDTSDKIAENLIKLDEKYLNIYIKFLFKGRPG